MALMKKIILFVIICVFGVSCSNHVKTSKESPFYSLLTGKKWAVSLTKMENAIEFSDTVENIELESEILDKIKKDSIRDSENHKYGYSNSYFFPVLYFKSDYSLEYSIDDRNILSCGNGMKSFNKTEWWLNENKLYLDITGEVGGGGWFHSKIEYEILKIDSTKIKLRKIKDIINEYERR
jgi:hypothetical protein